MKVTEDFSASQGSPTGKPFFDTRGLLSRLRQRAAVGTATCTAYDPLLGRPISQPGPTKHPPSTHWLPSREQLRIIGEVVGGK